MFQNDELQNHLETSSTISQDSAVIAEWNMNIPGNIKQLGNYRYRRNSRQYSILPDSFDQYDTGNFYTNATDADVVNDYGYDKVIQEFGVEVLHSLLKVYEQLEEYDLCTEVKNAIDRKSTRLNSSH